MLIALNFYNRTAKIFWPYCNNLSDEYKEREKNNLLLSWQDKILLSCLSLSVLSKFSMRKDKHWFNSWAHLEPYLQVNYFYFATRFFYHCKIKRFSEKQTAAEFLKNYERNKEFWGTQSWLIFVSKAQKCQILIWSLFLAKRIINHLSRNNLGALRQFVLFLAI